MVDSTPSSHSQSEESQAPNGSNNSLYTPRGRTRPCIRSWKRWLRCAATNGCPRWHYLAARRCLQWRPCGRKCTCIRCHPTPDALRIPPRIRFPSIDALCCVPPCVPSPACVMACRWCASLLDDGRAGIHRWISMTPPAPSRWGGGPEPYRGSTCLASHDPTWPSWGGERTLHPPRSTVHLDGDARSEVVAGQAGTDGPGTATWSRGGAPGDAPTRPTDGGDPFGAVEAGGNAPDRRRRAARHRSTVGSASYPSEEILFPQDLPPG